MSIDAKTLTKQCIDWIKDWFVNKSGNAKGVILGISGGKDSTVVAALCVRALGKDKVYGVLMPNGVQSDMGDSEEVCSRLGIKYQIVNIAPMVDAFTEQIWTSPCFNMGEEIDGVVSLSDHTKTNIPPRVRMTVLYAIGQELGYRVVGTGNASEAFIGYFTKWGDGAHDFNPIRNLTTEEVIAIGDYLKLPERLVHKTPSDGLCGKTDEDNLGYTYEQVNKFMKYTTCGDDEVDKKIEQAHKYNMHKLFPIPTFMPVDKTVF